MFDLCVDVNTGIWANPGTVVDSKEFRLVAVGDICPTNSDTQNGRFRKYDEAFSQSGTAEAVYGDLLDELKQKDLSVGNLELSLSDGGKATIKAGPNLKGSPAAIKGVAAGGFDVLDMANNHTLDFGPGPLLETIELVRQNGMEVLGAGADQAVACRPVFVERAGVRVGLLAFAENADRMTPDQPGYATLAPGPNCNIIHATRSQCDLLVVFVHGGSEACPIPSPRMIRDYRSFADAGADAVIGHHAHTVQGMELHNGVPIIYNMGNFVFWNDPQRINPLWWKNMFVRLSFSGRQCVKLDVIPVGVDMETSGLGKLSGQAAVDFFTRLNRLSRIVADADLHERFWNAYCLTCLDDYITKRIPDVCDKITGTAETASLAPDSPDRRQAAIRLGHLFTCEAHYDVITSVMNLAHQGMDKQNFGVEEELKQLRE